MSESSSGGSGSSDKRGRRKQERKCLSLPMARRCDRCQQKPMANGRYRKKCLGPRSAGEPEAPEQPIAIANRVRERTIRSASDGGRQSDAKYIRRRRSSGIGEAPQKSSRNPLAPVSGTSTLAHSFALTPLYRNSFEVRNGSNSSGNFEKKRSR
jgi:hypothetical protein